MLEFDGINYWAVLVAWLVNVSVGALWYSPAGFSKQWTALTGIDILKIPQAEATKILISVAVSAAVQALALALVLHSLGVASAVEGVAAGLVLWLGFTAATAVGVTLYQRRSWRFLWLNASYFLVVFCLNSVILGMWR